MKKKFLYILSLTFVICLSSDVYSMEDQVTGEVQLGPAIFSWKIEGKPKFCDFMKKHLVMNKETGQQQGFIIPSLKNPEKPAI